MSFQPNTFTLASSFWTRIHYFQNPRGFPFYTDREKNMAWSHNQLYPCLLLSCLFSISDIWHVKLPPSTCKCRTLSLSRATPLICLDELHMARSDFLIKQLVPNLNKTEEHCVARIWLFGSTAVSFILIENQKYNFSYVNFSSGTKFSQRSMGFLRHCNVFFHLLFRFIKQTK